MAHKNKSGFKERHTLLRIDTIAIGKTLILEICKELKIKKKKRLFFYRVGLRSEGGEMRQRRENDQQCLTGNLSCFNKPLPGIS